MPAALKIGRVAVLAATDLWTAKAWNASGDKVTIAGVIHAPGITNAKTLRGQLLGHVDNLDEEVVPVTWAADSSVDGYYRVKGASVNMHGASLAQGLFDVSVELERVLSFANPVFESVLVGATLTNSLGLTGEPWLAVPNEALGQDFPSGTNNQGRTGADGVLRMLFFSAYAQNNRYSLTPANYYKNAATFEVVDAASTLQIVTGTQCAEKPEGWRLSNGLVRVTPGTIGDLSVSHYDGSTWETAKQYFIDYSGQSLNDFHVVSILRNSPEEVVIRLTCATSAGLVEGRVLLDVSLRRGDATVRLYLTSTIARAWRLFRGTAEAATSFTGGLRATANDAQGNRYVMLSATATSKDLTTGALFLPSSATSVGWGISNSIGGSGASGPNVVTGSQSILNQYFAAQSEVMSVAGR